MAKRERRTRIYYGRGPSDYWTVPYSNAGQVVELHRTKRDVEKGKPGISIECMNAGCINRHGRKFPHRVYLAAVTKTVAYVVDEMKGDQPTHAVRYVHNDRYGVKAHDQRGGREWLLRSGQADFTLRLSPRAPQKKKIRDSKRYGISPDRRPTVPYGALGRAVEAGLLKLPRRPTAA